MLQRHGEILYGGQPQRILVPLCGKTLDLLYLTEQTQSTGTEVVGVEFVERAVHDFFQENGLPYEERSPGEFVSGRLRLLCRDFLQLQPDEVGVVDRVYDRAALVALPVEMRAPYAAKLGELCAGDARMLSVTFEYEQAQMDGPPFSIPETVLRELFETNFEIEQRERREGKPDNPRFVENGLERLAEVAWELRRR